MRRFASDTELDAIQAALEASSHTAPVGDRIELAWHLRQRDSKRAKAIVDFIDEGLRARVLQAAPTESRRLALIRAEIAWLSGQVSTAFSLAEAVRLEAEAVEDLENGSDANWILLGVHHDMGHAVEREQCLHRSLKLAVRGEDWCRVDQAQAAMDFFAVRSRLEPASADLEERTLRLAESGDLATAALALETSGFLAFNNSQIEGFVRLTFEASEKSRRAGHIRRVIGSLSNLGVTFALLNNSATSFYWLELALEVASASGWPLPRATCLLNLCDAAIKIGHLREAEVLLSEALSMLEPAPEALSDPHVTLLLTRSRLASRSGAFDDALDLAQQARQLALEWHDDELLWYADIALATAFAGKGDLADARAHSDAATELARTASIATLEVESLLVSELVRLQVLSAASVEDEHEGDCTSRNIEAARAAGKAIPGYAMDGEVLARVAELLSRSGNYREAFYLAMEARQQTASQGHVDAARKLLSIRLGQEAREARKDAEFARALAASEERRSQDLERTNKDLRATLAELMATRQALERANALLLEASTTDPLTGLRNRRYLLDHIESDILACLKSWPAQDRRESRMQRSVHAMAFYLIDVDYFKAINDAFGHPAGDALLVGLQQRIREAARDSDHLIRWGGEEFLVVARSIERAEVNAVAERIRCAVASRPFELGSGVVQSKTCSIGYCVFPPDPSNPLAATWEQCVQLADSALYLAKSAGRNRCAGVRWADRSVMNSVQNSSAILDFARAGMLVLEESGP